MIGIICNCTQRAINVPNKAATSIEEIYYYEYHWDRQPFSSYLIRREAEQRTRGVILAG